MHLTSLSITSATALNFDLTPSAPVCILRGRHSDLALDLIRELMGDYGAQNDPDRVDDGRFVIHADVQMDRKHYTVCYIRNADFMGDCRMAVNFQADATAFSTDDSRTATREYLDKRAQRNTDCTNVLDASRLPPDPRFAETDRRLVAFGQFLEQLPDDGRPVFLYGFLDRLDAATDISPLLDRLASLGRQVFIAVCSNYQASHNLIHMTETEDSYVKS